MRKPSKIKADIESAEANLERLRGELAAAEAVPNEPLSGSLVKFTVQFDPHGVVYQYCAMRYSSGDRGWIVTGNLAGTYGNNWSWDDVLDMMSRDWCVRTRGGKVRFWLATDGRWVE